MKLKQQHQKIAGPCRSSNSSVIHHLTVATLAIILLASFGSATAADVTSSKFESKFYKEQPLFSTAPSETKARTKIEHFGPVGIGIDLLLPPFQMRIGRVHKDSPAEATGKLKAGQMIETINGEKLKDIDPRIQLGAIITKSEATDVTAKVTAEKQAAEDRSPNPALEAAIKNLKLPGIAINLDKRCVDIAGTICLDRGMLELVACTKGTKEHESIVALEARAMHIHTALLLLGAVPGNPAIQRAPAVENQPWIDLPPSGGPVDVLLVFPDKTGKPTEHPISEFITRAPAEPDVYRDAAADKGNKFPTHTFLFAGSRLIEDGPGPRKYLSDESGNVISMVTFGDELLCLPDVHSDQKDALEWQVNAVGLPAKGTRVTLRLRPQRKPAGKENVPAK